MRTPTVLAVPAILLPWPALACGRCAPLVAASVYNADFVWVVLGLAAPLLVLAAVASALRRLDRFLPPGRRGPA